MMILERFGTKCFHAIFQDDSPSERAAKTYSSFFKLSVSALTCRAIVVQLEMAMAKIIEVIPGFKTTSIKTTIIKLGTEEMISIIRCITLSTPPPFHPDTIPYATPIVKSKKAATKATINEILVP